MNQVLSERMVKKQHMQWTKRGAYLLLLVRTRVLNDARQETFRPLVSGLPVSHTPRGGLSRCTPSGVEPTEPRDRWACGAPPERHHMACDHLPHSDEMDRLCGDIHDPPHRQHGRPCHPDAPAVSQPSRG